MSIVAVSAMFSATGRPRVGGEIVAGVKHEAAALFHRPPEQHRHFHEFGRRLDRPVRALDVELGEEVAEAHHRRGLVDDDAHGALFEWAQI